MTSVVRVSAPSRLHFGLLRFAGHGGASYGGLGMMIDQPRVVVELQAAEAWQAEGLVPDRALSFARLASESCGQYRDRAIQVRVCESPAPHSGLGTGTQLALAIARGIRELWQLPPLEAAELATTVGRGKRSAVGSHGFLRGGLIWETGRCAKTQLGKLARRIEVPNPWRALLITLPQGPGLHGEHEGAAFDRLPPIPSSVTDKLQRLAEETILPAAEHADFESFAEAVHDYGRLSGSCFSVVQGGSFASPAIGQLVDRLREMGIRGVGQSSWGPTVFALAPGEDEAEAFVERIQTDGVSPAANMLVVAADNCGARVERIASDRDGPTI